MDEQQAMQEGLQYVEYAVTVEAERTDEAIARLQGRGIEYVWMDTLIETFVTPDGYGFEESEVDEVVIRAYETVEGALDEARLRALEQRIIEWMGPLARQVAAAIPAAVTEDPVYEFTPVEVRQGLVIRPPWDESRPEGETTLWIEPSAAFGTGLHPTTRHCLELMDDHVRPGDAVADLGAGSGILSIFARKKGAERVLAVDINPSSESAIEHHMELNAVEGVDVRIADAHEAFAGVEAAFDLVAVNVGGQEAIDWSPLLTRIVKADGGLLLSGIVEWIEQQVVEHYAGLGFDVAERRQGEEWVTLLVART